MDRTELINFFVALMAVLDPIGNLPVYLAATASVVGHVRRTTAFLLSLTIGALLLAFLLGGDILLLFFGITMPAFHIAGGIIILLTGLAMMRGHATGETLREPAPAEGPAMAVLARILVPVAVPLFVGPGSISTVILYGSLAPDGASLLALSGVIGVAVGVTFITLIAAESIARVLGDNGLHIATRILGVLLTAIAVQFILDGVEAVTQNVINPASTLRPA